MKKQIHANTHSRHRILALVLAFCLLAALLPATALAADKPQDKPIPHEKPDRSASNVRGEDALGGKRLKAIAPAQETATKISGDFEYELYEYWDGSNAVTGASIVEYLGSGTAVAIPASLGGYPVIQIGYWAFVNSNIVSVTIPNGVRYIDEEAFFWCDKLESINIPDSVTYIGISAFAGCGSLESITIPGSVTHIGNEAFSGCGLKSVILLDGVTSIGSMAFDCEDLENVTIPESVVSIGWYAFDLTPWFDNLCDAYEFVVVGGGVLIGYTGDGVDVVVPDNVRYIEPEVLYGVNITIPGSVISIGSGAFYNHGWMESVTILDGVQHIGDYAFYGCTGLENIMIPNSVISIGDYAFYGCDRLTSVTIPSSIREIGGGAFMECTGLKRATIESGTLFIDLYAFAYCDLEEVYFASTPPTLGRYEISELGEESSVFLENHPSLTLYYPAAYASDWAPNGESTWNGYKIAPYSEIPQPLVAYGDANCDGKITAADAALILRYIVKLDPLSGAGLANADANGDGKITAADAAQILRFIVKLENKLGPK